MSGSATFATDRLRLATAATRISARRTSCARSGAWSPADAVAAPVRGAALSIPSSRPSARPPARYARGERHPQSGTLAHPRVGPATHKRPLSGWRPSYSGAPVDDVAALLALTAAVCFALAATLWQKAALNLEGVSFRHPLSFAVLLGQSVWLLGLLMQIVGVVLQAAALDRGRVSIIQPLLVTTVIWALPLGYFLTHQTVGRREILGAAIIVVGLVGFASFGDPAAGVDDASNADWAIAVILIGLACIALLLFANRGSLSTRAAVLGTVAGMLYGLSATMMKPVVENLHTDGLAEVIAGLEFWIWAAAGIVGFLFQQLSLSTGKLVPSVATVSVANPVVSVMLGALVLLERLDREPPWHAVVASRVARRGTPRRGRRLVRPREGP